MGSDAFRLRVDSIGASPSALPGPSSGFGLDPSSAIEVNETVDLLRPMLPCDGRLSRFLAEVGLREPGVGILSTDSMLSLLDPSADLPRGEGERSSSVGRSLRLDEILRRASMMAVLSDGNFSSVGSFMSESSRR